MENILSNLETYGYIALFLYSLTGGFVGLMTAAAYSTVSDMNIIYIILIAFIANLISDIVIFYLARTHKKEVILYMKKYKKEVTLSRLLLKKYGTKVIFIQKYIQGVRTLIPIIFGISDYNFRKFIVYNIFASLIWSITIGFGSFKLGSLIEPYLNYIIEKPYFLAIFGAIIIGSTFLIFKFILRKR